MGYTTMFCGQITIEPPLSAAEVAYINKFSDSRRMKRRQGPYFVNGDDNHQEVAADVIDYNTPPTGQPGLWCQWVAKEDGTAIEWNEAEKFYESEKWMQYLVQHFLGRNPIAAKELPFLRGHTLNGEIEAQGEEPDDRWALIVKDNKVAVATYSFIRNAETAVAK